MQFAFERDIEQLLEAQRVGNALLSELVKGQHTIMAKLSDIQSRMATLQQGVQAETDAEQAIIKLLKGQTDQLTDLNNQLKDALANNDPAGLQAVSDGLDNFISTAKANTDAMAAAAVANTPAASA